MKLYVLASCAPGLERLLLAEARALKLGKPEGQPGGVSFTGTMRDAWRANIWLRTASRVLLRVGRFPAADPSALYAGARAVDWTPYVLPRGTLAVQARLGNSALDHGLFVAQKVKDAVVDSFRDLSGHRPSVDLGDPDLRIHAHIFRDRCTLLVDTSGDPLHQRGWRRFSGKASLKENLAAGLVLASGWDGRSPLLDPFCGSGTILVEAASIAAGTPPGVLRKRYAFERWPGHHAGPFIVVRDEARAAGKLPAKLILKGADASREVVEGARENLRSAGLAERIEIEVAAARDFLPRPGWNAFVVTNPPYGERVGSKDELRGVYRSFGRVLRERCGGFTAAILTGNRELAADLRLTGAAEHPMKNGPIDCRLLVKELPRG